MNPKSIKTARDLLTSFGRMSGTTKGILKNGSDVFDVLAKTDGFEKGFAAAMKKSPAAADDFLEKAVQNNGTLKPGSLKAVKSYSSVLKNFDEGAPHINAFMKAYAKPGDVKIDDVLAATTKRTGKPINPAVEKALRDQAAKFDDATNGLREAFQKSPEGIAATRGAAQQSIKKGVDTYTAGTTKLNGLRATFPRASRTLNWVSAGVTTNAGLTLTSGAAGLWGLGTAMEAGSHNLEDDAVKSVFQTVGSTISGWGEAGVKGSWNVGTFFPRTALDFVTPNDAPTYTANFTFTDGQNTINVTGDLTVDLNDDGVVNEADHDLMKGHADTFNTMAMTDAQKMAIQAMLTSNGAETPAGDLVFDYSAADHNNLSIMFNNITTPTQNESDHTLDGNSTGADVKDDFVARLVSAGSTLSDSENAALAATLATQSTRVQSALKDPEVLKELADGDAAARTALIAETQTAIVRGDIGTAIDALGLTDLTPEDREARINALLIQGTTAREVILNNTDMLKGFAETGELSMADKAQIAAAELGATKDKAKDRIQAQFLNQNKTGLAAVEGMFNDDPVILDTLGNIMNIGRASLHGGGNKIAETWEYLMQNHRRATTYGAAAIGMVALMNADKIFAAGKGLPTKLFKLAAIAIGTIIIGKMATGDMSFKQASEEAIAEEYGANATPESITSKLNSAAGGNTVSSTTPLTPNQAQAVIDPVAGAAQTEVGTQLSRPANDRNANDNLEVQTPNGEIRPLGSVRAGAGIDPNADLSERPDLSAIPGN